MPRCWGYFGGVSALHAYGGIALQQKGGVLGSWGRLQRLAKPICIFSDCFSPASPENFMFL